MKSNSKAKSKICPHCNNNLQLDKFYKSNTKTDGLTTLCKPCFNARYRKSSKVKTDQIDSNEKLVKVNQPSQNTLTNIKSMRKDLTKLQSEQLYEVLPLNTPFTIKDILKALKVPYTDKARALIQYRIYTLLSDNKLEKAGHLHNRVILYIKKSDDLKDATFEPNTCLKCGEPIQTFDATNPTTKLCHHCTTSLTTTTKPLSPKLDDDMERVVTLMHNEVSVLNEKLNAIVDVAKSLNSIEHGINNLQKQNQTLIKIFAANCRTLPPDVDLSD